MIRQALDSLEVSCPNVGCAAKISRGSLSSHLAACVWQLETCPHDGCDKSFTRIDLPNHVTGCTRRAVTHSCGLSVPIVLLQRHIETDCPEEPQLCRVCNNLVRREMLPGHMLECIPRPTIRSNSQLKELETKNAALSENERLLQIEIEQLKLQKAKDAEYIAKLERDVGALKMELSALELKSSNEITRLQTKLELAEQFVSNRAGSGSAKATSVEPGPVWRQSSPNPAPSVSGSQSQHSGHSGNSSKRASKRSSKTKARTGSQKSDHSFKSDKKEKTKKNSKKKR